MCSLKSEHLTEKLINYKRNANTLLHYGDRNQISYSQEEIHAWTNKRKERLLSLLDQWHKRYTIECRTVSKNQEVPANFSGYSAARMADLNSCYSALPLTDNENDNAATFDIAII